MALQALSSPVSVNPRIGNYDLQSRSSLGNEQRTNSPSKMRAAVSTEYYSSTKFAMQYTSSDGDSVSLSFESVNYQKSIMEVAAEGDPEEMKSLIKQIKDEFQQAKKAIIEEFIKGLGGEVQKEKEIENAKEIEIPEWQSYGKRQK